MDIKTEVRRDIWKIMSDVYILHPEMAPTKKQIEFLDKVMNHLNETFTIRHKKDKKE